VKNPALALPYPGPCTDCCGQSCSQKDALGAPLQIIVSGISFCGCPTSYPYYLLSGTINGSFSVPYIGPGSWSLLVSGAITNKGYGVGCTSIEFTETDDLLIQVNCVGGNFQIQFFDSNGGTFQYLLFNGSGSLSDTPIANSITNGQCDTSFSPGVDYAAHGGSVMIL
jgi:hypothetical protein